MIVVYMQLHSQQLALSLDQDPGDPYFPDSEMRRHLFKILKEKKLKMFAGIKETMHVWE